MYSTEELNAMKPKMFIEYRISNILLNIGNFNNIPKNAWGAYVSTLFPVVDDNENLKFNLIGYNLFIGKELYINDLVKEYTNISEYDLECIKKYQDKGITKVVITKFGIKPLQENDIVLETFEEMATAISRIKNSYESINSEINKTVESQSLKLQRI